MPGSGRKLGYLADIDGLRALAVIAVILFHLKLPGFSGGYVGVDIFFVISGFLISGLIRERVELGDFRFSGFYAARINRLLPAVLATVAATALASVFILQPAMMSAFATSALASVFSAANFVFYFESGYWDAGAEMKPLLHLWSLGVEEQFYLFWPALIVLLCRASSRVYQAGLVVVLLVSLSACIGYTAVDSAATFYLLPFRIWQFALGALTVELWRHVRWGEFARQFMRSTGLALCGVSIVALSETATFPGWLATVPSLGAALVLASAHETSGSVWLANPTARWLGRLSYALYLVHWPPVALYRCYTLEELTPLSQLALGGLTFVLAIALHFGVERQFYRRHRGQPVRWRGPAGYALATASALAVVMMSMQQYPDRFTTRDALLTAAAVDGYNTRRYTLVRSVCRIDALGQTDRCPVPDRPAILFIGNSHEPDAYNIVATALGSGVQRPRVVFGSIDGCRGLRVNGDWAISENPSCQRRLDALKDSLKALKWHTVVYGARKPYAQNKEALVRILETLRSQQPQARVVVVEDYLATTQRCANLINQFGSPRICADPEKISGLPGFLEEDMPLRERVEALANATLSKVSLLCRGELPASCPTQTPEGHPVSMDEHHMTFEFAAWTGGQLAEMNPLWLEAMRIDASNASPP